MFRNIFHRAQGLDGTVSTAGTRLEKRPHVALGGLGFVLEWFVYVCISAAAMSATAIGS